MVSGALHGHDALRDYLADLAAAGTLVDAYPYSFEAVGDCVIVSGALSPAARGRQRGDRSALVGVPRGAGKVASVASHTSRDDACLDARIQHLDVRPNGGRATRR